MVVSIPGFHYVVDLPWRDAFHNACRVLGEHDLLLEPESTEGKIFVGLYVMYSRLVFFCDYHDFGAASAASHFFKLHLDCLDSNADNGCEKS